MSPLEKLKKDIRERLLLVNEHTTLEMIILDLITEYASTEFERGYDNGHNNGYSEGYDEGWDQGKYDNEWNNA